MNIVEIAQRIEKTENNKSYIDLPDFARELGIEVPYVEQDRLLSYWIGNWCCTDTYVGYRFYFFDDSPVAFSIQTGRKMDEVFYWVYPETVKKLKEYLVSLVEPDEEYQPSYFDPLEDIGDTFKIHYNEQMIRDDRVFYKGDKVQVLEKYRTHPYGIDKDCKIQLPDGKTLKLDINDLDLGFHVYE